LSQIDAKSPLNRPAPLAILKGIEMGLLLLCLFILTGAPIDFLVTTAGIAPTEGLGVFWLPLLILAVIGVVFYPGKIIRSAFVAPPVLLLAGAVLLSVMWSVDRAVSMKESMFFFATIAVAFYAAKRFSQRELLSIMALLFAGLALVSTALALGMPKVGVMHEIHNGAWSGIWIDKNTLGRFFVMGFSVAIARVAENPVRWPSSIALALASLGLVLMSTSKTALVGLVLVLVISIGIFIMRRGPVIAAMFAWISAISIGGLIAILLFAPGLVFGLLHRDATLTSRTQIWAAAERLIEQRPTKGYGYGAVWEARSASAPVAAVHQEVDFKPVNGHSSWIDARLETGKPGFYALAFMMGFAILAALFSIPWSKSAYWTLPALVMLLQTSLAESVLMGSHGTETFLFILLTVLAASSCRPPKKMRLPTPNLPAYPQPVSTTPAALSARIYQVTHPMAGR
jgi:O-antigen ligase